MNSFNNLFKFPRLNFSIGFTVNFYLVTPYFWFHVFHIIQLRITVLLFIVQHETCPTNT